jgi:hypothetical protein
MLRATVLCPSVCLRVAEEREIAAAHLAETLKEEVAAARQKLVAAY